MVDTTDPRSPARDPAGGGGGPTRPKRSDVGALTDATRQVSWYRPERYDPVVLEGVERRRKEIEKRRRDVQREKEMLAADAREGWVRVWKTVAVLVVVFGVGLVYWKLQLRWGNRWPLMDVWLWASAGVVAVIWWALRAVGRVSL